MSKKVINELKKIKAQPKKEGHTFDAFSYMMSYMWDDDDDFGTFDNTFDFEELIDILDAKELDRLDMDYDFLANRASDKSFENEGKINLKPTACKHEMEKKFLITSYYFKCKKCNHEEG